LGTEGWPNVAVVNHCTGNG